MTNSYFASPNVPSVILMFQLKTQLAGMPSIAGNANLLADAAAIVASLPVTDPVVHFWDSPEPIPRNSSTMIGLAAQLGITTPAALDTFFINAKQVAIA